jgi:hypothetical protein
MTYAPSSSSSVPAGSGTAASKGADPFRSITLWLFRSGVTRMTIELQSVGFIYDLSAHQIDRGQDLVVRIHDSVDE